MAGATFDPSCISTLLRLYRSLIEPYISYGLTAWGQASNLNLNKVLMLPKRALWLTYFSDNRVNAFVCLIGLASCL